MAKEERPFPVRDILGDGLWDALGKPETALVDDETGAVEFAGPPDEGVDPPLYYQIYRVSEKRR